MNMTYKQSDAYFSHETCMIQVWPPNYIYLAGNLTFSVPNDQITHAHYPSYWYCPVGFSFGGKESLYTISVPLFFVLCDQYMSIPQCSLFQSDNVLFGQSMFNYAKVKKTPSPSLQRSIKQALASGRMGFRIFEIFEELLKIFRQNHVVFQSLPISCERK